MFKISCARITLVFEKGSMNVTQICLSVGKDAILITGMAPPNHVLSLSSFDRSL